MFGLINKIYIVICVLSLLILVFPLFAPSYFTFVATLIAVYSIASMGMVILTGHTGPFNLGFAGFIAIGAYSSSILQQYGFNLIIGLLASIIMGVIIGVLMGLPSVRLNDFTVAIVTYGFGFVVLEIIRSFPNITGGFAGLTVQKLNGLSSYYLSWIICGIVFFLSSWLLNSWYGRMFRAIRDSEIAAESFGIPLIRTKTLAFVISSVFATLSGALYAQVIGHVSTESFGLTLSLGFVLMIVVGGLRSLVGAFLGAIFWVILPELTIAIPGLNPIIFGATTILIVTMLPGGLVTLIPRIKKLVRMSSKNLANQVES